MPRMGRWGVTAVASTRVAIRTYSEVHAIAFVNALELSLGPGGTIAGKNYFWMVGKIIEIRKMRQWYSVPRYRTGLGDCAYRKHHRGRLATESITSRSLFCGAVAHEERHVTLLHSTASNP